MQCLEAMSNTCLYSNKNRHFLKHNSVKKN